MALIEILAARPAVLVAFCLVLGLLVGSFLNVVVYRLPIMLEREWKQQCCEFLEISPAAAGQADTAAAFEKFNLLVPDSHCPHCRHKIRPWQNIPVVSYLVLAGKCAGCGARISPRYPLVELVTGVLSALIGFTFGAGMLTIALLLLTWALLALTLIDLDHQLLPDNITLPLLWLGLLVNAVDLGFGVSLTDAVIGAAVGYLVLWGFYWIFKLATGKEGMGYGDFKLLAALGAWMGWQSLLPIIILSSLVGAVVGLAMIIIMGRDRSVPMPFGPYLAGAGFIMLVWGPQLMALYLSSLTG